MNMLSHMTDNAQCPGCSYPDETLDHLFQCPHPLLVSKRLEIIHTLRKKGLNQHIPHIFLDMLDIIITDHFQSCIPHTPTHPALLTALAAQSTIGINMFLRGYMATSWTTALDNMGVEHPQWTMLWILHFLWFDCMDTLWREQNLILHHSQNAFDESVSHQNAVRLHWFLLHPQCFVHRDRYLLNFSAADIPHFPNRTQKVLIRLLSKAQQIHSSESAQQEKGQSSLIFPSLSKFPRA
jgi:hypothetical protein